MGAGTVVSGMLRCFSEFLARRRAGRLNFLPEGLLGAGPVSRHLPAVTGW